MFEKNKSNPTCDRYYIIIRGVEGLFAKIFALCYVPWYPLVSLTHRHSQNALYNVTVGLNILGKSHHFLY